MPRYDERSGPTRLYVGHISRRTRTRDLEDLFSKYGRVRDVDMKHDFAFVNFSDSRDADEARYFLNGRTFDGNRIVVEFAKRGLGSRDYVSRGPPPGTGRCYNCGQDGHWARDCKAGDWKNKCYRCGERGHIERNCSNSPRRRSRSRSRSRSPVARRRRSRSSSDNENHRDSPRRERPSPIVEREQQPESQHRTSQSRSSSPQDVEPVRSVSPVGDRSPETHSQSVSPSPLHDADNNKSPVQVD